MSGFISGQELSRRFYEEAVRPVIASQMPGLTHSAALLGYGSDVLGYDTERSTDHGWGPRLILFLSTDDWTAHAQEIDHLLQRELPATFDGYAVDFGMGIPHEAPRPGLLPDGLDHNITITTNGDFLERHVGIRDWRAVDPIDWLLASEQMLLEVTAGAVHHDGLGELIPMREELSYYPDDVWRFLLSAQWRRISQQEAFVGRAGEVGDELGSAIIAADLIRDLMRLAFLIERAYAPYAKWFGTAFARLASAPALAPHFERTLRASSWQARQQALAPAYEHVASLQNDLRLTEPISVTTTFYYDRPFIVIYGERFADALEATITDERVRAFPKQIGSIDQWVNSTDILTHADRRQRLKSLYEGTTRP